MQKNELPISLTRSETVWGTRYLLFELVFLPSLLSLALSFLWPVAQAVHLDFLYFSVNFAAVLWIFRHFLLDSLRHTATNLIPSLLAAAAGFAVYQVLSIGLSVAIIGLFPNFYNVNDAGIAISARENLLLMSLGTIVLVPIVEETLFRGLVFGQLRRRNRVLGYVLSTLIFCAIHVIGYIGYYEPLHLLICLIQYVPAGVVLAWTYEYSGSIFAPTLIHMTVNAIGVLSMR